MLQENMLQRHMTGRKRRAAIAALTALPAGALAVGSAIAHPGHDHGAAVHAPNDVMIGPIPLGIAVIGMAVAALALYAFKKAQDKS